MKPKNRFSIWIIKRNLGPPIRYTQTQSPELYASFVIKVHKTHSFQMVLCIVEMIFSLAFSFVCALVGFYNLIRGNGAREGGRIILDIIAELLRTAWCQSLAKKVNTAFDGNM